jgi:hypothetical protein
MRILSRKLGPSSRGESRVRTRDRESEVLWVRERGVASSRPPASIYTYPAVDVYGHFGFFAPPGRTRDYTATTKRGNRFLRARGQRTKNPARPLPHTHYSPARPNIPVHSAAEAVATMTMTMTMVSSSRLSLL